MNFLVKLFQRETSSKEFIAVVDGLRFPAILLVVLFHINGYLLVKSENAVFSQNSLLGNRPPEIFNYGNQGVQLFFVISGFILALPWMRFYLGLSDQKMSLRQYFLRRLSRLEPPYILSLVIFFLLIVFVVGSQFSLGTLIFSFFASVFYVHNFIFPGQPPILNNVAWSLEVEVQFYILAPLFVRLVCRIGNKSARRILLLTLVVVFSVFGWLIEVFWAIKVVSLASYLQYFSAGILLCDWYLLKKNDEKHEKNILVFLLGGGLMMTIIGFQLAKSPDLIGRIVSPLLILSFYTVVFHNVWWRKIFSFKPLTLIGGMCYTIYLLHYQIISAVGRISVARLQTANFDVFYLTQTLIFLSAVLSVSAIYFLLVEKPCMEKGWYRKFGFFKKKEIG